MTKELQEIKKDTKSGVSVEVPDEKNLRKLRGHVMGKPGDSVHDARFMTKKRTFHDRVRLEIPGAGRSEVTCNFPILVQGPRTPHTMVVALQLTLSSVSGSFGTPSGCRRIGWRGVGRPFGSPSLAAPSYPFEPPKMKFITKVWHPNVSSVTGAICLDILKDQVRGKGSTPDREILLMTGSSSLAVVPRPDAQDGHAEPPGAACVPRAQGPAGASGAVGPSSALLPTDALRPQDHQVAKQYLEDHAAWIAQAKNWTETYAMEHSTVLGEKIKRLAEMGFPEATVRAALEAAGGDENVALEKLLG